MRRRRAAVRPARRHRPAQRLNPFDLPRPPGPPAAPGEPAAADARAAPGESGEDVLAEQVLALIGLLEMLVATPEAPLTAGERTALDGALYPTYAGPGSPPTGRPTAARPRCCATSTPCSRKPAGRTRWRPAWPGACTATSTARSPASSPARPTSPSTAPSSSSTSSASSPSCARLAIHLVASFVWGQAAPGPAPPAAGGRRGLERPAVPRGRGLPRRPGPPGPQALPGAGDHLPGRDRLPASAPGRIVLAHGRHQAAAEAGRHRRRRGRRRSSTSPPGSGAAPARRGEGRGPAPRRRRPRPRPGRWPARRARAWSPPPRRRSPPLRAPDAPAGAAPGGRRSRAGAGLRYPPGDRASRSAPRRSHR